MDSSTPNSMPGPEPTAEPQAVSAAPAGAVDEETALLEAKIHALQEKGRKGANWFYWVAGLSLLNSLLIHFGANIYFVVGMGVSLVADGVADALAKQHPAQGLILRAIAITFAVLASGVAVLFGWLANKRYLVPYALAMVLYALDGLIFPFFQDWLSVAFHAYALICLGSGFLAYRELNQIERELRRRPQQQVEPAE
jgi:hypothetical protein